MKCYVPTMVLAGIVALASCEASPKDSIRIDRIYAHALHGDAKQAISELDSIPSQKMTGQLRRMQHEFHQRFIDGVQPEPPAAADIGAVSLLRIFQSYWRDSLMKVAPDSELEERLISALFAYLKKEYPPAAAILPDGKIQTQSLVQTLFPAYLNSRGYHSTGFGKTGNLYDLLAWTEQTEEQYLVDLPGGIQSVPVIFMDQFLTLGWEEYATFGRSHPGGWTTQEAIFCVKRDYKVNSENFRVRLLAHEAQHYQDLERYPKLQQADLEYRAKLAALSQADKLKDSLIQESIINAIDDPTQAHGFADHCVIRDLSRKVFHRDYVDDPTQWEKTGHKVIHAAARDLLLANNKELDQLKDVERCIH